MIDLGDRNIFIVEKSIDEFVLSDLIDFYENVGITCVFFAKNDNISKYKCSTAKYKDSNLRNVVRNNLFRADIFFIDSMNIDIVKEYTDKPVVVISSSVDHNIERKFDYVYKLWCKISPLSPLSPGLWTSSTTTNRMIDLIKGPRENGIWSSSFDDLKVLYLRMRNLEDLGL